MAEDSASNRSSTIGHRVMTRTGRPWRTSGGWFRSSRRSLPPRPSEPHQAEDAAAQQKHARRLRHRGGCEEIGAEGDPAGISRRKVPHGQDEVVAADLEERRREAVRREAAEWLAAENAERTSGRRGPRGSHPSG